MLIAIPRQLNLKNASRVVHALQRRVDETELQIDFTGINFVYPAGTVLLFLGLKSLLAERQERGLKTQLLCDHKGSQGCGYLAAFRFFNLLGITQANAPNPAASSARYMALTHLPRDEFLFDGVAIQAKLDQTSLRLAQMLVREQDAEAPMVQALSYALRESIRNVFEHAETDDAFVMGQSWGNGKAEFALGDAGVGIHETLSRAYDIKTEAEALRMAVLPGITEYSGPETRDVWQNSGYGLYMMGEVARGFGRFDLASSGHLLTIDSQRTSVESTSAKGVTILALQISVPQDVYWSNYLEAAKVRGEEKAKTIPGARTVASRPSGGMLWK